MKIRTQLIFVFLTATVFIISVVSLTIYFSEKKNLKQQLYQKLEAISETKADRIREIIKANYDQAAIISKNEVILTVFDNSSQDSVSRINRYLSSFSRRVLNNNKIHLVNLDGKVIASSDTSFINSDWSSHENFITSKSEKMRYDGFHFNEFKKLKLFLSAPVTNKTGKLSGVIIIEKDANSIISLTATYTGLGRTGETVLAKKTGDRIVYLTPIRHDKKAALVRTLPGNESKVAMGIVLNHKVDSLLETIDYRGVQVLSSGKFIEESGWGLVTKMDLAEAMEPVKYHEKMLFLFNIGGVLLSIVIAYFAGNYFAKPIEDLIESTNIVKGGDLGKRVRVDSINEIGILSNSFNEMADKLSAKILDTETFASAILNASLHGIIVFESVRNSSNEIIDFQYVYINESAEKILGRSKEELVGKRWLEEYPGLRKVGLFEIKKAVIASGEPEYKEFAFNEHGFEDWFRNGYSKFNDGLIVTFEKITSIISAQKSLEKSENLLLESQQIGKIGTYEWHIEEGILTMTPELCNILGYDVVSEIKFTKKGIHPFEDRIHPDDLERVKTNFFNAILNKKPYQIEYSIICPPGIVKEIWTRAKVNTDENDNPVRIVGTLMDITERKQNKKEILKREALLKEAQEIANMGSYEIIVNENKVYWSDQLYKLYGYLPGEFELTLENRLMPIRRQDRQYFEYMLSEQIYKENQFTYQFRFVRKDGSEGIGYGTAKVFRDIKDFVFRVTGVVQDITERIKIQEELERVNLYLENRVKERTAELLQANEKLERINEHLDKYAYIISHDLKAPLAAIEGLVPILKEEFQEKPLGVEGNNLLDMIISKTYNMRELIEQVLISAKEEKKVKELINLFQLAQEVISTLNPPHRFNIFIQHTLPVVKYHRTSLVQVLQNLLSNAIKYMDKEQATVNIGSTEFDDYYQIVVTDNGAGIPKNKLGKIFEAFEIAHTRSNVESHGIGLSIVKTIVEENGGRIWVESEEGKGANFYFTVPK